MPLRLASRREPIGTIAGGADGRQSQARKQSDLGDHPAGRGAVTRTRGCAPLIREGKSLLPIGMTAVEGIFPGDVIAV